MFEVVGASNWTWRKREVLVGTKKPKAEPPGLSFGQRNMRAFVFCERGPYWGGVD